MPHRLKKPSPAQTTTIELDGHAIEAVLGEPAACSLLAAGETLFSRSVKYHRARGPFCFSGSCSNCLMRVDGVPNVHTCRTPVNAGLQLERQNAYPSTKVDVFATIDYFFPKGLDHHEMFAGVPIAETVMAKVARQLSGLGMLPSANAPLRVPAEVVRVPVAILGGGAAGCGAATELAQRGVPFLLFEREARLGGRLIAGAREAGGPVVPQLASPLVRLQANVVGLYDDAEGRFAAVVTASPSPRLAKVYAERFLIAVGGHPQLVTFGNNDFPGVYAARAALRLLRLHHLAVGKRLVVVGWGEELQGTVRELKALGMTITAAVDVRASETDGDVMAAVPVKAHGRTGVAAITVEDRKGRRHKIRCDAILCAVPLSPGFELAEQSGAFTAFDPEAGVFCVVADARGRTGVNDVFVAGEIRGPATATRAWELGGEAARAIADDLVSKPGVSR